MVETKRVPLFQGPVSEVIISAFSRDIYENVLISNMIEFLKFLVNVVL